MVGGNPIPFWLGADMIPETHWHSIIPEYMGRNWIVNAMTLVVDLQTALEPGRLAYPHMRYREVKQWTLDRNTGEMTWNRDTRFEREFQKGLIYKPIAGDQQRIYKSRLRSCVGNDCRVWDF